MMHIHAGSSIVDVGKGTVDLEEQDRSTYNVHPWGDQSTPKPFATEAILESQPSSKSPQDPLKKVISAHLFLVESTSGGFGCETIGARRPAVGREPDPFKQTKEDERAVWRDDWWIGDLSHLLDGVGAGRERSGYLGGSGRRLVHAAGRARAEPGEQHRDRGQGVPKQLEQARDHPLRSDGHYRLR